MNTFYFLHKTFLENIRDWKMLSMALILGPFFIFLMWGYFNAASPAYSMMIINDDGKDPVTKGLVDAWQKAAHPDGKPVFKITFSDNRDEALDKIESREAALLVRIPKGFGAMLAKGRDPVDSTPPKLIYNGDATNTRGTVALSFSDYVAYTYAFALTGKKPPLEVAYTPVGNTTRLSEFDMYVPALLVLAIIMVLFTSAATLIRETENRTMMRLTLSKLTTSQMMMAVAVNQVLIALCALALSVGTAYLVGYRPTGNVLLILPVGALGAVGVVAIGVLTAAFLKTIFELLTVGVFPFFILMFFSDCMFPLPKIQMVTLLGHTLNVNDILPTSLTVRAFNQILNHNASFNQIWFELIALTILTAAYFTVGVLLFKKKL